MPILEPVDSPLPSEVFVNVLVAVEDEEVSIDVGSAEATAACKVMSGVLLRIWYTGDAAEDEEAETA
jgi:hypothetical protein